jgi:hypothetical protein
MILPRGSQIPFSLEYFWRYPIRFIFCPTRPRKGTGNSFIPTRPIRRLYGRSRGPSRGLYLSYRSKKKSRQ